jgi:hypothetical protein
LSVSPKKGLIDENLTLALLASSAREWTKEEGSFLNSAFFASQEKTHLILAEDLSRLGPSGDRLGERERKKNIDNLLRAALTNVREKRRWRTEKVVCEKNWQT